MFYMYEALIVTLFFRNQYMPGIQVLNEVVCIIAILLDYKSLFMQRTSKHFGSSFCNM